MAATRNKKPSCSVVIPVHNSSLSLPILFNKLDKVFKSSHLTYEIVAVEDGSRDRSWEVLKNLLRTGKYPLKALRLSRNFGQHNALLCGMKYCGGKYVVTMDDDLQHRPRKSPLCSRNCAKAATWFTASTSTQTRMDPQPDVLAVQTPAQIGDSRTKSQLYLVSRHPRLQRENILGSTCPSPSSTGPGLGDGQRGTVRVRNDARAEGKSGYNLFSLLGYTLDILTTFSSLPLRIASVSGFIIATLGFIYGFYLIIRNFVLADATDAYTPLMAGKLFLSGIILIAVGINGEYLGRVNHKTTGRPRFVESENLALDPGERRRKLMLKDAFDAIALNQGGHHDPPVPCPP